MLYDPKWEKQTEKKAAPLAIGTLIAWLERQDPQTTYCYVESGSCLLAQYFEGVGFGRVTVCRGGVWYGPKFEHQISPPDLFHDLAQARPHTFGAALTRARAAAR